MKVSIIHTFHKSNFQSNLVSIVKKKCHVGKWYLLVSTLVFHQSNGSNCHK